MTSDAPFVQSVLHPTDFSESSEHAFAYALAIALRRDARLTMLHSGSEHPTRETWSSFPGVRDTLTRWKLLDEGSPRSAILDELHLRVEKIAVRSGSAVSAVADFVEDHPTDLIVLATEGREGLARWLRPSVAERAARKSETMTLFVPQHARDFISLDDGSAHLTRIVVPVDERPSPSGALEVAARAAGVFGKGAVAIDVLHVGTVMPRLSLLKGVVWNEMVQAGDPVDEIVRIAERHRAGLIVMATAGHEGFVDALRGSTTEQVLRRAPCPVLAVPAP